MANNQLVAIRDFFVPLDTLMQYDEIASFVREEHPDTFRILDFFQFFLHKDSPLAQKEIKMRAAEAYKLADLDMNAKYCDHLLKIGETSVEVVEGIPLNDSKLFMMLDDVAACFLSRVQNDNKWEMLITLQTLYWEYTMRLRSEVSMLIDEDKALKAMDIKTKITQPCFDLIKQIDQLKKDIFGDNKRVAEVAEVKIRKVSPETMAKKAGV